jgi:short-chain 2-methylacyl-CoA dehydrogenase
LHVVDFDLAAEHALVQQTVREFARDRVAPAAGELDRTKAFPYEIVRELGDLGLMGIPFPAEYGGAGADTLAYALAVEELARVDSSVAITLCAHISLGTQPIYMFGSEEQRHEWLPRLCSG